MHERVNICNLGEESPGIWTLSPSINPYPQDSGGTWVAYFLVHV